MVGLVLVCFCLVFGMFLLGWLVGGLVGWVKFGLIWIGLSFG